MSDSFEIFWNMFDNKKSRDKVERKWHLMSAKDQIACMESLPRYIKETPDRQYRKHPATYLNNKCWNDKIYSKDSETVLYKTPEAQKLSNYKPKEYDQQKAIDHMRDKLKRNYENGSPIKDWGGIYTTLLTEKCGMDILKDTERIIREDVELDANRNRNRFEPQYTGNIESDIRDKCLNWWLKEQRNQGIKVYENL